MSSKARRQLTHSGISLDELVQIIQALSIDHFTQSVNVSEDLYLWKDTYMITWMGNSLFLNFQMTETAELMLTLDPPTIETL